MTGRPIPWFTQYRMDWIAETLRVFGFINRHHLVRKFGMSRPQASLDLQRFQQLHPGAMVYDMTFKSYVEASRPTDAIERGPNGNR